jgi:hypothetical protein
MKAGGRRRVTNEDANLFQSCSILDKVKLNTSKSGENSLPKNCTLLLRNRRLTMPKKQTYGIVTFPSLSSIALHSPSRPPYPLPSPLLVYSTSCSLITLQAPRKDEVHNVISAEDEMATLIQLIEDITEEDVYYNTLNALRTTTATMQRHVIIFLLKFISRATFCKLFEDSYFFPAVEFSS